MEFSGNRDLIHPTQHDETYNDYKMICQIEGYFQFRDHVISLKGGMGFFRVKFFFISLCGAVDIFFYENKFFQAQSAVKKIKFCP